MNRMLGMALVFALVCLIGVTLFGRAVNQAVQTRVLITRGGVTLDCEREVARPGEVVTYEDGSSFVATGGEVSYRNCVRVP